MQENLKAEIKKVVKVEQWTARKLRLLKQAYKKTGGDYKQKNYPNALKKIGKLLLAL